MPVRVVVGEDDVLLRAGVARILSGAGLDVVAESGDAVDFLRKARAHRPDVAVVDVQMPPRNENDGLRAALELRAGAPETGILILSQFYEESFAVDLIAEHPDGVGYLLKERVGDVSSFIDAVKRVAAGGTAMDPVVVGRMLGRATGGPLDSLTPREREVLAEMAEGKSNRGIATALHVTDAAVEKHVRGIFSKLGLDPTPLEHRRVLAVLEFVRGARARRARIGDPPLYMAALAFTAYGVHWFALGLGRTFAGDPRPNSLMAIPFMVISALGALVFFGAHDNPVAALFCGLFAVYVCEFFASLGAPRRVVKIGERALGFVHIVVGMWLMYLTVAAALNFARGFNLPL